MLLSSIFPCTVTGSARRSQPQTRLSVHNVQVKRASIACVDWLLQRTAGSNVHGGVQVRAVVRYILWLTASPLFAA